MNVSTNTHIIKVLNPTKKDIFQANLTTGWKVRDSRNEKLLEFITLDGEINFYVKSDEVIFKKRRNPRYTPEEFSIQEEDLKQLNLGKVNFLSKLSGHVRVLLGESKRLKKSEYKGMRGNSWDHKVLYTMIDDEALIYQVENHLDNIFRDKVGRYFTNNGGYEGSLYEQLIPILLDRLEQYSINAGGGDE